MRKDTDVSIFYFSILLVLGLSCVSI
eukprot:UN20318